MPQDNGFSPLFSGTSPGSQPPQQPPQVPSGDPVQREKTSDNIFGTLVGKDIQKEQTPPLPNADSPQKDPAKKEPENVKADTPLLPNVTEKIQSVQGLPPSSKPAPLSNIAPESPVSTKSPVPAEKVKEIIAPLLQEKIPSSPPAKQPSSSEDVCVSEVLSNTTSEPLEKIQTEQSSRESQEKQTTVSDKADPVLATYLQADRVYQEMLRLDNHEKIRFRLAIRYLLLMFVFFLVFAWIVNNRIIMFGFSEFLWLARIRDGLFASIAGLFALTIWLGSVTWTRNIVLVSSIRLIGILFFVSVLVALYFPL